LARKEETAEEERGLLRFCYDLMEKKKGLRAQPLDFIGVPLLMSLERG